MEDTLALPIKMPATIAAKIPTGELAKVAEFDRIPDDYKVIGGSPSVPPELLDILPVGEFKAATVNWPSFHANPLRAKTEKNAGKALLQIAVGVEVAGKSGTIRFFRNQLEEFTQAAESGKLLVARVETKDRNNSNVTYQGLIFKTAA